MSRFAVTVFGVVLCVCAGGRVGAAFELGPEQFVEAGGVRIKVPGYSVPSFADYNSDGLNDLIIGEGGGYGVGKVRVYLNEGTIKAPSFSSYSYVKSNGADLEVTASGCLGIFPGLVQWDGDGRIDLLAGLANGKVQVYLNTGTNTSPAFDGGNFIQVGPLGMESSLDVGYRATPSFMDFNNDGLNDLVSGAYDGKVRVFLNVGDNGAPSFMSPVFIKVGGSEQIVPDRSSPVIVDINGDGKKDLLCGNANGTLLLSENVGTEGASQFDVAQLLKSSGQVIDLAGTPRSRPFVTDWTGDGHPDVFVGAGDGYIHLFQGVPEPATVILLGLGAVALRKR